MKRTGPRILDAAILAAAALVTVAFTSSLQDTALVTLVPGPKPKRPSPPPPTKPADRDAKLAVNVTDPEGARLAGAEVRVISVIDGRAYVAATATTDGGGALEQPGLPRGEAWILVEAPGRQRASVRVFLAGSPLAIDVVLRRARALVVEVIDEQDRPLEGATIELSTQDPLPFGGTTDAFGRVSLGRLAAPPWTLIASAKGHETVRRTLPSGQAGDAAFRVVLRKLGVLSVSVKREDGTPAEGATVLVSGPTLWPARKTEASSLGIANIAGLPAGSYEVVALGHDTISKTENVPMLRGEDRAITLTLTAGRRITTKIIDAEGDEATPVVIEGASVVLVEDGISPFPREGKTAADGTVTLGPIVSGRATVSAVAPGFVARSAVKVPNELDGPLVIALARGGTVRGEVRDTKGFAIEGASIEIIGTDIGGMPIDETPENAALRATHFAFALGGPRPLIPMGELGVTVGPVPGIPRPGEGPPAQIVGESAGGVGANTIIREGWATRADGHFRATPVPPGRVRALVRHPGYVENVSDPVSLAPGKEAVVKVVLSAGGSLRGRVKTANGQPVAGARVEVAAVHGSLSRSTLTSEDGSYWFAALPGQITVSLCRPEAIDRVVVHKAVTIREDTREELDLVLPAPRDTVVVRVTDDRRSPLDNVQVSAVSVTADQPFRVTQFTRQDGVMELPDAEGLALRVEVSLPGYATVVRTLGSAKREETIELFRAVHVKGEIRGRRGVGGLEGAEIAITTAAGTRRARSDREGRWVLRDLAPGPAKLVASHPKHAPLSKPIDLPAGDGKEPLEIDRIELEDGAIVNGEVVDAEGHPVPGARVARDAVPAYVPTGTLPRGVVLTDGKGRFALGELPLGDVVIEAYAASIGRGTLRATLRETESRDVLRIVLADAVAADEPLAAGNVAITLEERADADGVGIFIKLVVEGSEADRGGLRVNDEILRIGKDVPTSLEDARRRLAGPAGEDILIVVLRAGREEKLRILRERTSR